MKIVCNSNMVTIASSIFCFCFANTTVMPSTLFICTKCLYENANNSFLSVSYELNNNLLVLQLGKIVIRILDSFRAALLHKANISIC